MFVLQDQICFVFCKYIIGNRVLWSFKFDDLYLNGSKYSRIRVPQNTYTMSWFITQQNWPFHLSPTVSGGISHLQWQFLFVLVQFCFTIKRITNATISWQNNHHWNSEENNLIFIIVISWTRSKYCNSFEIWIWYFRVNNLREFYVIPRPQQT